MRLAYALLANSAEFTPDGKLYILGGDIDTLYVRELPATQPVLTLAMKLLVPPTECDVEHRLQVSLIDPDEDVGATSTDVTFTPRTQAGHEGRDVGVGLSFLFQQQQFTQAGEYIYRILVDDKEQGSLPLRIVLATLPSPKLELKPTERKAEQE
jgi:hypothetical protein